MAQRENKGVFGSPVMPGPSGVFVYAYDTTNRGLRRPSAAKVYTLSKEEKKGSGFKKLAALSFPGSAAELEKRMDKALLQEILQKRRLRSVEDLYAQLRAGHLDTLGIYGSTPPVLSALGILYIDTKETRPETGVSYKMEVTENGNTRVMYQIALADIRYSPLPVFRKYRLSISDSTALVTWYATGNRVSLPSERPRASFATVFTNAGSGTENTFNVAARLYVYGRRDTLFASYSTPTIPGSKVLLYIRPEDVPGNRGLASDTVHLLALSFRNTFSIEHLTGVDTLGAVWLKWDKLPAKAWCSGIEVLKSRSATQDYIVIDTLPISAVSYRDRKVISGNVYYYQLRPILFDLPQKGHITPALVNVRTKKGNGKIAAPQGLQLSLTPASNIRLSWQPNPDLDIFAYYILRGTSKGNMQVISPGIRDTVFIDSLKGLNAGISYLYSVAAVNMDMHWSDTSAPVGVQSPRARLVTSPGGIRARATPLGVRLSWDDVREKDASVTGYMVYRRKKGETYFIQLSKTVLPGAYFTDSSALVTEAYEYGCASVDAWGHVGILSALAAVSPDGAGGVSGGSGVLTPPAGFILRNLPTGIGISLPSVVEAGGHGTALKYILYRRTITEKKFHKLGELAAGDAGYTDRQVVKDQLYVYALAVQAGTAESGKSGEKSIRRK